MKKIVNYFFDEEEMDLVEDYKTLIKIATIGIAIGLIAIIL
jgi:hypothetical protein